MHRSGHLIKTMEAPGKEYLCTVGADGAMHNTWRETILLCSPLGHILFTAATLIKFKPNYILMLYKILDWNCLS